MGGPQRVLRNLRYSIDPSTPEDSASVETAAVRARSSTGRQRVEGKTTVVELTYSAERSPEALEQDLAPQRSTSYSGAGVAMVLQGAEKAPPGRVRGLGALSELPAK